MSLSARIAGVFLLLFLSFRIFTFSAFAQTASFQAPLIQVGPGVPLNISTLTQGVLMGFLSSATCVVGGIDFLSTTHRCLTYNVKDGKMEYEKQVGGGLLGLGAAAIALTYNTPFHTADYVAYLRNNFGVAKHAYAANTGLGFDQLKPITQVWLAFRNLAYLFFVIIFIVVGFAVMIRAKIDPRTVMTIENQIPKLVIAIILISFSFAIAGLAIDIMWVATYLVINLFAGIDPVLGKQLGVITSSVKSDPFSWVNSLNNGPFGFIGIAQQAAGSIKDTVNLLATSFFQSTDPIGGTVKNILGFLLAPPVYIGCLVTNVFHISIGPIQVGQDFGKCLDEGYATIVSTIIGGIVFLIFAFALLVAIFRLWWSLIKSYALFLVYVIFGPLMIMAGVLPESKVNFDDWFRHILAYLIIFPTAITIFLLGKTLMDVYSTGSGFVPPLIGTNPKTVGFLGPLLGFAVMMLAPSTANIVQEALKAPDFKFLPQVGQGIATGAGFLSGGAGKVWQRAWHPRNEQTGEEEGGFRTFILGHRDTTSRFRQGLREFVEGKRLPGR